jgi:hypothetical protein
MTSHQGTAAMAAIVASLASSALAQFSPDAGSPLPLASGSGEQVQPKVVAIPSGGFYVSWYDGGAGYDPWVQRFDDEGNGVWPNGGVRVLDTNFSSTEDYGLTIDAAGNAVVVTRRDSPSVAIVAQAVSPAGAVLWGPTGVVVSGGGSVNSPKAGRTGDGFAVAGWTEGNRAKVLKLNADGTPGWPATATVTDNTATTILADLQPGGGGSVIASVVRYTTFTGAKTLQAQKFSSAGAAEWVSTNVRVFATGSLQFGNFPPFLPDGSGGAVFAWYTSSPLMSRVQWVAADGTLRFGANGTAVTTDTTRNAVNPAACVDPVQGLVYCAWVSQVPNSSLFSIGAQCLNVGGKAQFGATGIALAPEESVYSMSLPAAAFVDGGAMFTWKRATAFTSEAIYAQRVTQARASWLAPLAVTTEQTLGRQALTAIPGAGTPWALSVFEAGGTGVADLFGARINLDGTLGTPAGTCGDLTGDGVTDGADLGVMLSQWGQCAGCAADFDGNGLVDGADLGILLSCWTTG